MARAKYPPMTAKAFINIDGEDKLWYEVDADKKVTWYLPKDISDYIVKKAMENVGEHMSEYLSLHPEATLWNN